MQPLPIAPIAQTLSRFIEGVASLLSESELEQTQIAADNFAAHDAPILQQRLIDYADVQAQSGHSWLTKIKLAQYLQDRRSLALSNNASLQLDYPDNAIGVMRAASFIHRMVRTHIDYMNDEIAPPVDPRDQPISMYNWRILTGAIRVPHVDEDYYYYASNETSNRHISVLWQGHHITLQITDDQGQVYSVAVLRQALNAIMDGDYDKPALDFTTISALGSTKTAQYLGVLNKQPENLRAYTALCDSLFTFSLYRFEDQSEHSEMAQIHEQTFMPGHAWQFKPINYQMDLESEFLAIHFEHSEIDGAALNHILNYAFALELDQQASKDSTPHWQLLDWVCDQVMATNIKQDVEVIRTQAEKITPQFAQVDYGAIYHNDSSIKVSHDAMMQLALLYAQLKIFGQVRHTYEAVDTSQFTAGRTEGMRPNSAEAIALCQALLSDNATQEQLKNAFTAHKQRVIACKTGQGFDRHLTGLKAMMSEASQDQMPSACDFFTSVGYKLLTGGDFLSTSSMGIRYPIKRILFAPTYIGGFGVNYSLNEHNYEFLLFADGNSSAYLDDMCQACIEGINKIIELL